MAFFGRPSERDEQKAQEYAQWMQQRNPFAIESMVLGVFSLVEFGVLIVFGVGGIVCGVVALRQLSSIDLEDPGTKPRGHRLAWGGIALSVISLIVAAILYLQRRGHA